MSLKADLEGYILESYHLIYEYEEILRLADDPRSKARSRKAIDDQWVLIKSYLDDYIPLCERLQVDIDSALVEIVAHFPMYSNSKKLEKPLFNGRFTEVSVKAIEMFFSYAHEDEILRNELTKQLSLLKREGFVNLWHDRQINPGQEWAKEIDTHLNTAHIILMLVSPDFIASDYCYSIEMNRALERHNTGEAHVIPVILRPTDWKSAPFSKLQALPMQGKPITMWTNRDEAFLDVAKGIRNVVEKMSAKI